jgi:hypothetical protein
MADFGKWWKDPKKHVKRRDYWLPHWKNLAEKLSGKRPVRYFTLCARPMIDIFMLVREGLLSVDGENHSIGNVRFCELDPEHFAEIKDLIATEDAGFQVQLEAAVLFQDDSFTGGCPTLDSIAIKLEDERLQNDEDKLNKLHLKRTAIYLQRSFPYDCLNLDFCEYYYPDPPDMMKINLTVERILEWQGHASDDGTVVDEFVLAVTCRHDAQFPQEAEDRLRALILENCKISDAYKKSLVETRGEDINQWLESDREDFFFAGWPKDIAGAAKKAGWAMQILDYVHYRRVGDHDDNPYLITCLIAHFSRDDPNAKYLLTAFNALAKDKRTLIGEIDVKSPIGEELIADLTEIVDARNVQAGRVDRPPLPSPSAEPENSAGA